MYHKLKLITGLEPIQRVVNFPNLFSNRTPSPIANMSQRVEELKQTVNKSLNDSTKPWKAAFDFVEEKSGVPRLYLFSGKCEEDDAWGDEGAS